MSFPNGTVVKNSSAIAGDLRDVGSIPGSGRSPGAGNGNPLLHTCLEISMVRGAQRAIIHGVAKSQTQLSARARAQESICLYYLSTYNTSMLLLLSCFSRVRLCTTPLTAAHQAPLSIGFSGQEYWSGLPCPPPGDLPNKGTEMGPPALQARFFTAEPPGKGSNTSISYLIYVIIFLTLAKKYATYNSCKIYSQKQRQSSKRKRISRDLATKLCIERTRHLWLNNLVEKTFKILYMTKGSTTIKSKVNKKIQLPQNYLYYQLQNKTTLVFWVLHKSTPKRTGSIVQNAQSLKTKNLEFE